MLIPLALPPAPLPLPLILAQLPSPSMGHLGTFLLCAFAVIGIIGGMLVVWNQGREAFGRTPTYTEELKTLSARLDAQLAEVDAKRSSGIAGTHAAIERHAAAMRAEIVPRQTLESELVRLAADERRTAQRVECVADMVTDAREDVKKAGEARLAVITTRLDHLDRCSATHEERSKNTQHTIDSMAAKIDSLLRDRGITCPPAKNR